VTVGGLNAFGSVRDLDGKHNAGLQADVVRGEHFLPGNLKKRPAHFDESETEVAAPPNVTTGRECADQLAFVIEQAGMTLVHNKFATEALARDTHDNEGYDAKDRKEKEEVEVHREIMGLMENDETCGSSHQEAAGGMVGACRARLPFSGTRVRAAAADPLCWESNPSVFTEYRGVAATANEQNHFRRCRVAARLNAAK
jgi:hypothetical protein